MTEEHEPTLFPMPEPVVPEPKIKTLKKPIWTENKASLIDRYLFYFVMITRHGTYIDGFAGPQSNADDSWAAKLVLESEPKWFRRFFLFDQDRNQIAKLEELRDSQPGRDARGKRMKRTVEVRHGDFNKLVDEVLSPGVIGEKEATFCLLDQRTFECEWETVRKLAQHKKEGNKIELFYFLPIKWLGRALAAQKNEEKLRLWWGRDDFEAFRTLSNDERRDAVVARFKDELGYVTVKPWPIYEREDGGTIMYYMVHATDHPEAPMLMARAYNKAVTTPKETAEQLELGIEIRAVARVLPTGKDDAA